MSIIHLLMSIIYLLRVNNSFILVMSIIHYFSLLRLYPTSMWGGYGTIVASMHLSCQSLLSQIVFHSPSTSSSVFLSCFLAYPSPSFLRASSPLLITYPYHRIMRFWSFFKISPTFVLPLIFSFLILSNLVTPHIHRNIFIYATAIFLCAFLFTAHVFATYTIAGLIIVLYAFPLILAFILLSHGTPYTLFHLFVHLFAL